MSDTSNKTTHANRRRLESQEATRRKLQGGQFIRRLKEIAEKADTVEAADVPGLRLKADIYMKLLGKVLPDLKSIEHSGEIARTAREMSPEELDERIARLAAREEIAPAISPDAPELH